ncbi:endonuclease YncB(thermonuclease family) [Sinorhizobium medicae]
MKRYLLAAAALATIPHTATAADLIKTPAAAARPPQRLSEAPIYQNPVYNGRVAVMDGRTLWYPQYAQRVRLVEIDACELPQWAIDPKWVDRLGQKAPSPVPCGPLAKAWLKRTIGSKPVECTVLAYGNDGIPQARCTSAGRDIAIDMLRAGWARVASPYTYNSQYLAYQQHAMAARSGMWATYVLDMNEWRRKAVDKTLDRQPIADFNLLVERESEISPPSSTRGKSRRGQTDSCPTSHILRAHSQPIRWRAARHSLIVCAHRRFRTNLVGAWSVRPGAPDPFDPLSRSTSSGAGHLSRRLIRLSTALPGHSQPADAFSDRDSLVFSLRARCRHNLRSRRSSAPRHTVRQAIRRPRVSSRNHHEGQLT